MDIWVIFSVVWAINNKVAKSRPVQIFLWMHTFIFIFPQCIPRSDLLGHEVDIVLFMRLSNNLPN